MAEVTFDYKDVETLKKYLNATGGIKPRGETGLTDEQQHRLARAVKRARYLALLPCSFKT